MVHFKSKAVARFKSAAIFFCRERTAIILQFICLTLKNHSRGLVYPSLANELTAFISPESEADRETLDENYQHSLRRYRS